MNAKAAALDAGNRLLWRKSPTRIEGESLRDSILSIAGKLDVTMGGKGYRDMREYKFKGSHFYDPIPQTQTEQFRRTIYRFSPRGAKRTMLDTFDCPDPSAVTPKRAETTTPLQSLSLMNNAFVLLMADAVATRLQTNNADVDGPGAGIVPSGLWAGGGEQRCPLGGGHSLRNTDCRPTVAWSSTVTSCSMSDSKPEFSRRELLAFGAYGLTGAALSSLVSGSANGGAHETHFEPKSNASFTSA